MKIFKTTLAFLVSLILVGTSFGQPQSLQGYLSAQNNPELDNFYRSIQYRFAWLTPGQNMLRQLSAEMGKADLLVLDDFDNELKFLSAVLAGSHPLKSSKDSFDSETRISLSAFRFYSMLAYGSQPQLGYNGLLYTPACYNIPILLAGSITNNSLANLPGVLDPGLPGTRVLQDRIRRMHKILKGRNLKEQMVIDKKAVVGNRPLVEKLLFLGMMDSIELNRLNDKLLIEKIKEAQRSFGLLADGTIRSTLISELNIPLATRLRQLKLSLDYFRWLSCLAQKEPVIVVNIPAAYLWVYDGPRVLLEMRMVVGKTSTPTSPLTSRASEVVLYPYWHVPYSIATRELLPIIKRNPGYINEGNYQVLNKNGKIIDPWSVNWRNLSASYFPYIIRQSTGCDNALGLLKVNFFNPFGGYLHDTPVKNSFSLNRRFLSHGCMRMEKPMEMGHLLLSGHPLAIDSLEQKGCVRNAAPIHVPVDKAMAIVVWYNPAGVDATGRILYFPDIYKKFPWIKSLAR